MMMLEKIEKLKTWLKNNDTIEVAILFGSYAKETQTIHSDLDLAITLTSKRSLTAKQKINYIIQLSNTLSVSVDLIDLKNAGQPLLSQIIKYGKQLKGNRTQYAEIAIKNINTNQDFTPYIKRMLAERRTRLLADG